MANFGKWIEWANEQTSFDYEGYRITAPFRCMCCGTETSPAQWAYGRTCGRCDTGACQSVDGGAIQYDHPVPEWHVAAADSLRHMVAGEIATKRAEGMKRYAAAVGAEPLAPEPLTHD